MNKLAVVLNEILKKTLASLSAILVAIGGMAHANPTITLDVRDASSIEANTVIRPGVVAYGLGFGGDPNLDTLEQYLDATNSSVGDVIISALGQQLRTLNKLTGDPGFDVELDDLLSGEIQDVIDAVNARQAGGRVQMKISCSLPDHLSLYPGVRHDAQSGLLHPTEHPISACGPIDPTTQGLDNGKTPQEEWASIMEKVAARYQNQNVYFVIGDEPENYFNGTFEQFLPFAKYTASGLRSGNPDIEIGIGIGDLQSEEMRRTNPVFVPEDPQDPFDDPNGHYEMTAIKYEKPLIDQYLEYIQNNQLDKIDAIQYKQFNKSPFPASTAFWHKNATYIDNLIESLGPTNEATNGPVKLMVTDYPNWHTTCSDDIEAIGEWIDGESIWDSEYMAAMYTSAYLGMADFNHQNFESGSLTNIEQITPHLSFLVNWGVDIFFHSSCEADGSKPAGFGGSIGLNSLMVDIPKPIAHVLNILDALEGKVTRVSSSHNNLYAYSGYSSQNTEQPESVTLVVSHFVPTGSKVNTYEDAEGLPTYEFGHLWQNDYGVTTPLLEEICEHFSCQDPLKICCTAQEFQDMVYDPNGHFPRNMTKALIVDNANPNDWGLPAGIVDRTLAVQSAGQANRALPSTQDVDIVTKGLAPSTEYLFSLNTIDDVTGNAYTDRYALNTQLETEWDVCRQTYCAGKTGLEYQICMRLCMTPLVELIQSQYSFASTTVHTNVPVWTNESGELYLTLSDVKKNSVDLINITSAGDPGDQPPQVRIVSPADGTTVPIDTETVFEGTAVDEDGDLSGSLSWSSSLEGHLGNGASVAVTLGEGVHTITASVTDSASQAGQDEVTVTVSNPLLPTTMAVADLDGMSAPAGRRGGWEATVSITVMDNLGGLVDGAVVSGAWSAGTNGFGTCTTGASGTCDISKVRLKKNTSSVTFSVTGIDGSLTYSPGDNGDPDGDSNGTDITVLEP